MHVDEAGCDDEAGGIDALAGLRGAEVSDRRNLPVPNADVQPVRAGAPSPSMHRPPATIKSYAGCGAGREQLDEMSTTGRSRDRM